MKSLTVLLSILLAIIGGTGVYKLSAILMNSIYAACLIVFIVNGFQRYAHYHAESVDIFNKKFIVFFTFIIFLLINFLIEISIYSEYAFNSHEGTAREYGNLFRCFVGFLLTGMTYSIAKQSKIFIFYLSYVLELF